MKKAVTILIIFFSAIITAKSQNCNFLCNGDFENPVYGKWIWVADSLFPCWQTTESDSIIEVWWTGFLGVPAYHGNQFVELDANVHATVYQNFLIAAGTNTTIGFAHRGRMGVDTMSVSIGPVGGPYVTIGTYADGNTAWGYYTVNYTIPLTHGNYYCLRLNSIYSTGGPGYGNFVDDISVVGSPGLSTTVSSTNILCQNGGYGSASVIVSSGVSPYTYVWSPSGGTNSSASGLSAGVYTCFITDANGCSVTDTITITQSQQLTCTIPPDAAVLCNGANTDTATVNISGGTGPYTYNWSPGGGTTATIRNLSAGTYSVTVKDSNGCLGSASVTLTQSPLLSCNIPSSTNILCNGEKSGSATAGSSGGISPYTYSWSPGGGTTTNISNLSAGTYTVVVNDSNGCAATATVTITQPPELRCIPKIMDIICDGGDSSGSVTANAVGGTPPYTYNWSPGGGTTATLSALSVGTYTVSVNDANGCKGSATATIKALPPSLYLCCDTTIIQGGSGIITADSSLYYKWEPATGLNCDTCQIVIASPTITTTYTVTGTDGNGCTVVKEITVIVENVCAKFTVPNVFTPDFQGSSGVNNVFYIKTVDLSAWSITIYDRWGKEMYTSNNPDVYWDGNTEGGSKASDGVYYYIISATCQGNTYKRDGFVQLIR